MAKTHAPLALLVLAMPVFSAACGASPSEESTQASTAAVTSECNLAPANWSVAEPPQTCIGPPVLRNKCEAETALWEDLQQNCQEPGEVAYFGDGPPKGAFYAWCTPGTYGGTSATTPGGCSVPGPRLPPHVTWSDLQLVVWTTYLPGALPNGCNLVACVQ